jgi:hypothetical protein
MFSNLQFDINTPSFTATNTSNNMIYTNQSNPVTNIGSCEGECSSSGDPCTINFPDLCNGNQILAVPNVTYSQQGCDCVGGQCAGIQTNATGNEQQYCGIINDKQMCQIGTYGTGSIDGPSAVKGVDWGLANNPTGINSGWINCVYLYDFPGSLNNQNYIGFRNWIKSVLSININ